MAETEIKSINGKTLADITARENKLDKNQGTVNAGKILGIGADGIVVPQDKPTYTLPQATADALGGIKADAATAEDTQVVRIGTDGKLRTKPTGGSSITVDSALSSTSTNPVQNKVVTAALAGKITAPTTAAVGQIIKVKSVDESGKPTEWEAVTAKLANPNALTFTGAVTGSYDGSAPLSVEIPSGGGSGSDISLGLTGAAVGQIAKITAVDDTGKPTAWSPVDMPSGGGGSAETFELIKYIKTTEAVNEIRINADDIGEPLELKEVQIYTKLYLQDDVTAPILIKLHSSTNGSTTKHNWPFISRNQNIKSNTNSKYPAVCAGHFKPKDYTIDNKKYWVADTWSASTAGMPSVAGAVNRLDFLMNGAYETHVMDAVRCVLINANNGAVQIGANSEIWIFGKRGKVT